MTRVEQQAIYRADKRAAGLCYVRGCQEPSAPGRGRCQPHADKAAAYMRDWHAGKHPPKPKRIAKGRQPKTCKGCKLLFVPKSGDSKYCGHECFLKHRQPWRAPGGGIYRMKALGSVRQSIVAAGLCACTRCMAGRGHDVSERAELIARVAAEKGVSVSVRAKVEPETREAALEAFQARITSERDARIKQLRNTHILDYPVVPL